MSLWWARATSFVGLLTACSAPQHRRAVDDYTTTSGSIAIANLDHHLAQVGADASAVGALLARARFLGDYGALDRAVILAERPCVTALDLLRRARSRSAVHRFADALEDLAAAERAGADTGETLGLRAPILVATGRARAAISVLERAVASRPEFATHSALASAYAAVGRLDEADSLYVVSLRELQTTSPFPYAWVYFARGVMWAEQGGDATRGAVLYRQALVHLPQFVAANIRLAEIEAANGMRDAAVERLERIVASGEPDALALLGTLHVAQGDTLRGSHEIARARAGFEALLARHPLAFADHAAEFYLGPGANPERAVRLAQVNFANRRTGRAAALVSRAANATLARQGR